MDLFVESVLFQKPEFWGQALKFHSHPYFLPLSCLYFPSRPLPSPGFHL